MITLQETRDLSCTDINIRIRTITKAVPRCPGCHSSDSWGLNRNGDHCKECGCDMPPEMPDYTCDFNAMHEALQIMTPEQAPYYWEYLVKLCSCVHPVFAGPFSMAQAFIMCMENPIAVLDTLTFQRDRKKETSDAT